MVVHKTTGDLHETICNLVLTDYMDYHVVTTIDNNVNCPQCLKIMGEANSKQQSGTYTSLPIQPWHFAEINSLSFLEGCVVKRVCRHRQKDGAQDIDKAIQELELLKKHLYDY